MNYLRWAFHQLFLLYFQPSRFKRDVEDRHDQGTILQQVKQRAEYVMRMLPCIVLIASAGNLVLGSIFSFVGAEFDWRRAWIGVVFGAVIGVVAASSTTSGGVAFGVASGIASGVTAGIAAAVGADFSAGVPSNVPAGVAFGVAFGVAAGIGIGLMGCVINNGNLGRARDIKVGILFGIGLSTIMGTITGFRVGGNVGTVIVVIGGVTSSLAFLSIWYRCLDFPLYSQWATFCRDQANVRPNEIVKWWRRHPLTWNEGVYFKLPKADEFLFCLAQHNREFGLSQIDFVAAHRSLQCWAAKEARLKLAVADIKIESLSALSDSASKLEWLTPELGLPDDTVKSISDFRRIGAFVAQAGVSQNFHRRLEALDRTVAEVEALQKRLPFEKCHISPQLQQCAKEWMVLLKTEQELVRNLAQGQKEIPQVFRFGNPVRENESFVFAGRKDVAFKLEQILLADRNPPAVLIYGPRRMGKSSVLLQLSRLLGPNFPTCYIDWQNAAIGESPENFLTILAEDLTKSLSGQGIKVKLLDEKALAEKPFTTFGKWLEHVEETMPSTMKALFCFDEYEILQTKLKADFRDRLLDYLRHLQQHHPKVVLIFGGVKPFHALGKEWTSRFISSRALRVSYLSADELRPMLENPYRDEQPPRNFPMRYAPGVIDHLSAQTHGQPFLAQAVAYELVNLLNNVKRHEATIADVDLAARNTFESATAYFDNIRDDAGEDGFALLSAVARGDSIPVNTPVAVRLREMDVLSEEGTIVVPLLKQWILAQPVAVTNA